ncbi:hypothetical protein DL771_011747 [Monosporascus sp. 5C6A]|nr:hypothetical protein DL771_011747 [Monosporascus sp. 5C6A]
MATARKRPRPDNDETQAGCPFTVTYPDSNETKKKARRRRQESEREMPRPMIQRSPFSPLGEFKHPNGTLDRRYRIQPFQRWIKMTRYNSFVLKGVKYYNGDFIFVANSSTIKPQKNPHEAFQLKKKSDYDWVARILEIRASDGNHVYARVYWMYWPGELPSGTQEGKRIIQGRQSYHGQDELIASNHMDVIDVFSVTASATVNHWDENKDEVQSALYWRQALDVRNRKLSVAQPRCRCKRPENPDKSLTLCTNEECKKWLHDRCLVHEALLNTYKRLGNDKPHKSAPIEEGQEEGQEEGERPKRLLSPSESGVAQTAQHSIDVDPEEQQATIKLTVVENGEAVKTKHSMTGAVAFGTESKKGGRPRKWEPSGSSRARPYEGLFEAAIRGNVSPLVIEIRDLRENVTREEKEWTESIGCLVCGHQIN